MQTDINNNTALLNGDIQCERRLPRQLIRIVFTMAAGMTLYESVKQLISPGITVWESHIVTIIFSTTIAAVTSFFVLRKYIDLNSRLNARRMESEGLQAKLENTVKELKESLATVKTLSGMLPICSHCKKIRDDEGYWDQIEIYIRKHSEVDFSHGLCPDCAHDLYPDYFNKPHHSHSHPAQPDKSTDSDPSDPR